MLLAAIDIGTNSIHMVIARSTGPQAFEVVDRERDVVQIGRGSFGSGRLRADAIQRSVAALARFVRLARRRGVDRILCTATAAVREARNGGEFLAAAKTVTGVQPRVIPGREEGRLIYLAVKGALQLDKAPSLMVDIGGGSMQLVAGDPDRMLHATSAPLGALRLTEQWLETDPPTRRELSRMQRAIRKALKEPLAAIAEHEPQRAYGSSGSIHALAHVAASERGESIEQINGYELPLEDVQRLARRLSKMTVAERERLQGIDAKRAEIIVPGALVLAEVLQRLELDSITISDFGVREGLVIDWLGAHARELTTLEQVEDLKLRSVIQLAQKFDVDMPHAEHVATLALALFDGLRARHGLGSPERETLHYAALLHDVGNAIGFDGHAEHSYYVIRHGRLRGLSAEEIERIAVVARFHSKTKPRKREKAYRDLVKPARLTVRWLSALLRIAEGLDRSHYQLIRSVRVVRGQKSIGLKIAALGDAQLELWSARRRADVLEDLLGMPVRVTPEAANEHPEVARRVVKRAARRAVMRARGVSGEVSAGMGARKVARRPILRAVRRVAPS